MEADLEVGVFADLAEEEAEDGIRLGFGHANNAANEACRHQCGKISRSFTPEVELELTWVDIDSLPTCSRMNSNHWVDSLDRLASHGMPGLACTICLSYGTVNCVERFKVFLERGAE